MTDLTASWDEWKKISIRGDRNKKCLEAEALVHEEQKKLGINTAPGHVWKNLHTEHDLPKKSKHHLGLAAAIGLALRAADNPYAIRDII